MAEFENFDVSHLGAVELYTPKFEESLHFFTDLLSMREVARIGDSAYLRCWDEYELYSIKLTASHTNGVGLSTGPPARKPWTAGSRPSKQLDWGAAGKSRRSGSDNPTSSRTPTGTSWPCTTTRSGIPLMIRTGPP